ncbi:MAG: hypothetical protein V3U03_17495 [Myxococcota bacterium]
MATAAALLVKVEAAIDARLDGGAVDSYAIRGRSLQYMDIAGLFKLRDQLAREVEGQKIGLPVAYGVFDRRIAE